MKVFWNIVTIAGMLLFVVALLVGCACVMCLSEGEPITLPTRSEWRHIGRDAVVAAVGVVSLVVGFWAGCTVSGNRNQRPVGTNHVPPPGMDAFHDDV